MHCTDNSDNVCIIIILTCGFNSSGVGALLSDVEAEYYFTQEGFVCQGKGRVARGYSARISVTLQALSGKGWAGAYTTSCWERHDGLHIVSIRPMIEPGIQYRLKITAHATRKDGITLQSVTVYAYIDSNPPEISPGDCCHKETRYANTDHSHSAFVIPLFGEPTRE